MITGATGYLGSEFVKILMLFPGEYEVSILKRSASNIDRLSSCISRIKIYNLDEIELTRLFKTHRFDSVVHCATDYGRINDSWLNLIESNLMFPLELLRASIDSGVPSFINIDTMLSEHISNYSLSKSQFRKWLKTISKEIAVANIRMEHFYGPGDGDSKFIASILKALINGDPEIPLTSGLQKRDFIFIEDALEAIHLVLKDQLSNRNTGYFEYELGSGESISIRDLVQEIKRLSGNRDTYLNFGAVPFRQHEAMHMSVNLSALSKLGWTPKWNLVDGLNKTIEHERRR